MADDQDGSLWIVFQLDGQKYVILSSYVEAIIQVPKHITPLPGAPDGVRGVTTHKQGLLGIIDLRSVFHIMDLAQYTDRFSQMKEMHITWVEELKQSVREGRTFTKAVDPHKCQFGQWYDHFQTDNHALNFILKRIAEPHAAIHRCGAEIQSRMARGQNENLDGILVEAERICTEEMVPLLDELIAAYQEANRGILLIVSSGDHRAALLVDEVSTLLHCETLQHEDIPEQCASSGAVKGLLTNGLEVLLELDVDCVLALPQHL